MECIYAREMNGKEMNAMELSNLVLMFSMQMNEM